MGSETQNKMLDLLSKAYQVVDDKDKIDALMDDINMYLFEGETQATIAKNLPKLAEFDPHLERHIDQLELLMQKRASSKKMGLSLANHAQFIMSHHAQILTANSHAQKLLNAKSNLYLNDLELCSDSKKTLRGLLAEVIAGVQDIERVVYLRIGDEQLQPAFGYCRSIPTEDDKIGLHISLSSFEWTPAIFDNLELALKLSASEGLVLQGVLKGQSRMQIATERGRSISTIKAQANAILQKTNCSNMSELAHLCTSIAYIVGLADEQIMPADAAELETTPSQSMHILPLSDNRELAYYEYGDLSGQPVLFFHGFFQGPFFTDEMKRKFLEHKLRVIAPSRPHFGYTSPPVKNKEYTETSHQDTLSLLNHLQLNEDIILLAHHAGGGFASRFCANSEANIKGMVRIGAGLPVNDEQIKYMGKQARMAAVASRHAPSIMRLLITLGIKSFRKAGVDAMIRRSYADVMKNSFDLVTMQDRQVWQILTQGMMHLIQQGAEAFVHDGRAQMLDWTASLKNENCRQIWINGKHCSIVAPHFVQQYITDQTNHSVEIIEDAGYNILFQSFDLMLDKIDQIR